MSMLDGLAAREAGKLVNSGQVAPQVVQGQGFAPVAQQREGLAGRAPQLSEGETQTLNDLANMITNGSQEEAVKASQFAESIGMMDLLDGAVKQRQASDAQRTLQ